MGNGVDPVQVVVLAVAAAIGFALTVPGLISSLHALQQDDYSNGRFARWLAETRLRTGYEINDTGQ